MDVDGSDIFTLTRFVTAKIAAYKWLPAIEIKECKRSVALFTGSPGFDKKNGGVAITNFSSDETSFITGNDHAIDGGFIQLNN